MTPQELNTEFERIHAGILAHYDGIAQLMAKFNDLRFLPDETWEAAEELSDTMDKIADLEYDWEKQREW
jgi:hypothetical protein